MISGTFVLVTGPTVLHAGSAAANPWNQQRFDDCIVKETVKGPSEETPGGKPVPPVSQAPQSGRGPT